MLFEWDHWGLEPKSMGGPKARKSWKIVQVEGFPNSRVRQSQR